MQVLDADTINAVRLAALVLLVAHTAIAAYGAWATATADDERKGRLGSPVGWFFKLWLTGAGGLAKLRGALGP